jgi:nucleotide-binding universal stress UspA family protein
MYAKMLVPLDGSPNSERIVRYARSFADAFGSSVELTHVIHPDTIEALIDPEHGRFNDAVQSGLMRRSAEYLDRIAESFSDSSKMQFRVEIGEPAEIIIDRAAGDSGILVAMSTRGYSGVKRWLLGSVANKVLHGVKNPLLFAKAEGSPQDNRDALLTRMLVPLDGSGLAEEVLPHVAAISKAMSLRVELLQVYAPPLSALIPADYQAAPEDFPGSAVGQAAREKAERYLEEKRNQLVEAGVREVSCMVVEGEAAHRIIETAQSTRGSMVAMCTHGRSGVRRWALGSVTERVLSYSDDPLLVIPAPDNRP